MSHIKDIEYEWDFGSNYDIVTEYLPLLPARTKYNLFMDDFDLKIDLDLDEKLRMLNWNEKRIYSIYCLTVHKLNVFNKIGKIFKSV